MQVEEIIKDRRLFKGVDKKNLPAALHFLKTSIKKYRKGELLLRIGDRFESAGIVLEGLVNESCVTENFNRITLSHYQEGSYFGFAFAVERVLSPVQLSAQTDCTVLWVNLRCLIGHGNYEHEYQNILANNLTHILAAQNIATIGRLHVASQSTIHDKLIAYLHTLNKRHDGYYQLSFTQTELAEHLSVNRSALSRELSKMKETGQLEMHGRLLRLQFENS